MILPAMLYVVFVAIAISVVAWAAERLIAPRRWAHRFVWIAALASSLIVPILLILTPAQPTTATASPAAIVEAAPNTGGAAEAPRPDIVGAVPGWQTPPELDTYLVWLWSGLSGMLLLLMIGASWRLRRRMRDWPVQSLDGQVVRVTTSTGPAVCGVFTSSILVPGWVVTAAKTERELILLHEQCHLRANDPLLFWAALLLVVLVPWNLPMWWQLHRLRVAIEIDCDARVMKATDQDATTYGEVLLTIGQRQAQLPIGSVALNESGTQLERRLRIMIDTPRASALATGALILVASGAVVGAASLDTPPLETRSPAASTGSAELLMPPPKWIDLRWSKIDESLQALLQSQYPQLMSYSGDQVPLIEVLFKPDGSVERSELRMLASQTDLRYGSFLFEENPGPNTEHLAYVQPRDIQPPSATKSIRFHFGEHKSPTNTYAYANSLGDAASQYGDRDRLVLKRYFPDVAAGHVTSGAVLWLLLDSKGKVLETGRETARPENLNSGFVLGILMAKYPHMRSDAGMFSTVTDSEGKPLEDAAKTPVILQYVWLAADSPVPGSWAR